MWSVMLSVIRLETLLVNLLVEKWSETRSGTRSVMWSEKWSETRSGTLSEKWLVTRSETWLETRSETMMVDECSRLGLENLSLEILLESWLETWKET
jgi:hypothetical protein